MPSPSESRALATGTGTKRARYWRATASPRGGDDHGVLVLALNPSGTESSTDNPVTSSVPNIGRFWAGVPALVPAPGRSTASCPPSPSRTTPRLWISLGPIPGLAMRVSPFPCPSHGVTNSMPDLWQIFPALLDWRHESDHL